MRFDHLAELFLRHRVLVALFVALCTVAAVVGNVILGFDDVPRSVFRTDAADYALLEEVFAEFGSDDNDCILVVEPADPRRDLFTPEAIAALREIIANLQQLEGVDSVRSLNDVVVVDPFGGARSLLPPADEQSPEAYDRARREALEHPLLRGQVLAEDGRTALVIVKLAGGSLSISQIEPRVEDIRAAVEAAGVADTLRVRLTGIPTIRMEIFNTVRRESRRFVVIGAVLAFLMATVMFRRFSAVMIVASAPMIGAFWTMGALGLAGEKLNVINTILPTLVLVIGFTDAVHLMHDIRRSRTVGVKPRDAAASAIRHLGLACFLTSFTTGVGFASLAVAEVDVIKRFGLTCAVGAILAFLAVMTVVPLLSSTRLGLKLQASRLPRRNNLQERMFDWIVDFIVRYPRSVSIAGILITAALTVTALQLKPDNQLTETLPQSNESVQALAHCDEALGGMLMAYALIEWDEPYTLGSPEVLPAVIEAQELFDAQPGTSYPLSIVNLLEALPGPEGDLAARVPLLPLAPRDLVERFVRADLRRAIITVHLRDTGTAGHSPVFDALDEQFRELEDRYPHVSVTLTGSVVVAGRNINQMIVDLLKSLGLATVVIFGCMTIGFRSIRFGLISIVPNLFPLVFTAAVLVAVGQRLQLTSVIVFSICLGVAVDDTIHFLARFRRELLDGAEVPEAVRRSFHAVGAALLTTTVVLLTGFGSVLTSEMPSSRLFAWMSCLAISSALLGDLLFLPAMLVWLMPRRRRQQPAAVEVSPSSSPAAVTRGQ